MRAGGGPGHESLRREVNERVAEVNRHFANGEADPGSLSILVVCECGDVTCKSTSEMTLAEYEALRAQPNQLILAETHEVGSDAVVARRNGYVVIDHPSTGREVKSRPSAQARRDAPFQSLLSSER